MVTLVRLPGVTVEPDQSACEAGNSVPDGWPAAAGGLALVARWPLPACWAIRPAGWSTFGPAYGLKLDQSRIRPRIAGATRCADSGKIRPVRALRVMRLDKIRSAARAPARRPRVAAEGHGLTRTHHATPRRHLRVWPGPGPGP